MFWIKSVPLFHLGSCAFSSLFVKIKFTLTFQPAFILLMCVSVRGSLCACVPYTITSLHLYVYLRACVAEPYHGLYLNRHILEEYMNYGYYHMRLGDGCLWHDYGQYCHLSFTEHHIIILFYF